jgi:serine/threonine-protein kinase RsbW
MSNVIFATRLEQLAAIRGFIQEAGQKLSADPDAVGELILAVDEAASNILLHGYNLHRQGQIMVELVRNADNLEARISDQAPWFDPTLVPLAEPSLPIENRPIGGLGIFFIRKMVDQVQYTQLAGGGNLLILVKKAF